MITILNYIDGKLLEPMDQQFRDNINPSTAEVYSRIPESNQQDIDLAVEAAKKAFPEWSETPAAERSKIILRIADLIDDHLEELALCESIDNGKPVKLARTVDIPRASSNFRFFATAILHTHTRTHETDGEAINYTLRKPLGPVACISPWNLPLYLFTWKIAPAIASGNTVIAKPSEVTPMTAYWLSELCIRAGLPSGVLNIVHGTGPSAGQPLIEHPDIKAISFTGGTVTGKKIAAAAAPQFKKLSLELGGKNPNIIFADADFEDALSTTMRSSFANQGQICLCGSRIFIESSIYEKFRDAMVDRTRKLVVGDPMDKFTQIGALVSESHMNKVLSYVELAREEGGTVLTGGNRMEVPGLNGYFMQPAIIEGLPYTCRTNQEEIFGPVVTLTPFETEEEVLKMANSTEYGLSATIWTSDLKKAHRVAEQVQSGIVWVNCWLLRDLRTPFGGMKSSGVGREGGEEALRFFTEAKNVCIKK